MPTIAEVLAQLCENIRSACNSEDIKNLAGVSSDTVAVIGFAIALAGIIYVARDYKRERTHDKREREYGTFHDLDEKYVQFMYSCAQHPDLDLLSEPMPIDRRPTDEQVRSERAHYAVLISIFERATVMFEKRSRGGWRRRDPELEEARCTQWPGWKECMRMYCDRPSFLLEWRAIGGQFDGDFVRQMNDIVRERLIARSRAEEIDRWLAEPAASGDSESLADSLGTSYRRFRLLGLSIVHHTRRYLSRRKEAPGSA
ncbi:hypothetical protein Pla108_01260 [Botrimarina colliarenosi]|uniref:Uncharacterized protein n=1 Tax=Botrimarina colliarenosi TaxID=2528001 RepID=A0A5C6AJI1_9BACT|nr:hypothetical protein [Botrimarina colliarenosi]TWT99191.1 hypothetical protein Pla108_01260 [Botrimarina colliarenosi]